MHSVISVTTSVRETDSYVSFCSLEEFNSGLLHLLQTRLQSLHLQIKIKRTRVGESEHY